MNTGEIIVVLGLPLLMALAIVGHVFIPKYMWIGELGTGLFIPAAFFIFVRGWSGKQKGAY